MAQVTGDAMRLNMHACQNKMRAAFCIFKRCLKILNDPLQLETISAKLKIISTKLKTISEKL